MLLLDYPKWNQFSIDDYYFLEDERFEAPIVERFNTRRGRPGVPVRVFIRLMVLKFYTGLSYEDLVVVVAKTPMHKIFCRIPLDGNVPDATALMKIVKRYGEKVIEEINVELVGHLKEKGVVKGRKMRLDTTVMEVNISHPTDAGLLFEGVRKLEKAMTRSREACGEKVRQISKKTKEMKIQPPLPARYSLKIRVTTAASLGFTTRCPSVSLSHPKNLWVFELNHPS